MAEPLQRPPVYRGLSIPYFMYRQTLGTRLIAMPHYWSYQLSDRHPVMAIRRSPDRLQSLSPM
ncbi:hypothetical protein EMIT0194MI4_10477 [Pseudomonas sp. IT-194MI4]